MKKKYFIILLFAIAFQGIAQNRISFSEKVSNGIYNDFTIKLKSGKEEKYYFQIDHKRKMLEATGELKKYVDEGLLSYENFVEINR